MGGLAREERRGGSHQQSLVKLPLFFTNLPEILPLYSSLALGDLEGKFMGCDQNINFSGRWKHLGGGGGEGTVGGSLERRKGGTEDCGSGQGTVNGNNSSEQWGLKCPLWDRPCALLGWH